MLHCVLMAVSRPGRAPPCFHVLRKGTGLATRPACGSHTAAVDNTGQAGAAAAAGRGASHVPAVGAAAVGAAAAVEGPAAAADDGAEGVAADAGHSSHCLVPGAAVVAVAVAAAAGNLCLQLQAQAQAQGRKYFWMILLD